MRLLQIPNSKFKFNILDLGHLKTNMADTISHLIAIPMISFIPCWKTPVVRVSLPSHMYVQGNGFLCSLLMKLMCDPFLVNGTRREIC